MRRRTKISLGIYLVGFFLAECINLRSGHVLGAFESMRGVKDFVLWLGMSIVVAAAWPLWIIMIALQLMGIEF
jgi:hypothetical protein